MNALLMRFARLLKLSCAGSEEMVDEEENLDFLAALAALGDPPDEEQSSVCPVPDCATQNMKRRPL